MTSEMRLDSLVVSQDTELIRGVSRILDAQSIHVDVCISSSTATDLLAVREIDLLVMDWSMIGGPELVRTIRNTIGCRVTVAAVVDLNVDEALIIDVGAHGVIHKPLTALSKSEFYCNVYHQMVTERREEHRYPVRWLVSVADRENNPVSATVTNISEAGIGLSFGSQVPPEGILKCKALLPGTYQIIRFDAQVVWTSPNNTAGAEIKNISTADTDVLCRWLQNNSQPTTCVRFALH